jgi:DNA polymerase-3 subunit gamma/tau
MIAEAVTVLSSVPTVAPAAPDDAAAAPATEPDSDVTASVDAGPSPDATDATAAVAPTVPPAEPSDGAAVAPPEPPPPPPPTTAASPPEVAVTDPPALAPAPSDDSAEATSVSRKRGAGKAAPADDEGGDTRDADVVTPAGRGPTDVGRPVDAP